MKRAILCFLAALASTVAVLAVGTAVVVFFAGHWLEAPGQAPRRADAIAILGGDEEGERAERALILHREGYAPTLVLTGLQLAPGGVPAAVNWRAEYLESQGVPRSAIRFELRAHSTYTEAVQLLAMMRQEGWRTLIVVSDPPHMRRLSWMYADVFEGSGLDVMLVASRPDWWQPGNWWRHEKSGQFVIQELIKLGYYAAKR